MAWKSFFIGVFTGAGVVVLLTLCITLINEFEQRKKK